jgi:predicted flap endonuclease-1-like 5' DNA nuclease
MVSIFNFLPEYNADKAEPQGLPQATPHLAIGAASPLWLMFGGAAYAGAAYWWWASRWRDAVNLEALMAVRPELASPSVEGSGPEVEAVLEAPPVVEAVVEPALGAIALAVQTTETVLDAAQEIVQAAAEPLVETVVAANEDVAEAVVEPVVAAEPFVAEAIGTAADTATDAVEKVAATAEAEGDDLTRLVGVGPKLAASLAELGVTQFSQIAAWTPDELTSYDQLLNLKGRADRDAWIAQAKRFAETLG